MRRKCLLFKKCFGSMVPMTAKKEEKENKVPRETTLYELGYHLVPTIAEENKGGEVTALKDSVEAGGGTIVSDEFPKTAQLAYKLSRMIEGKKKVFTTSFFGWMRFEMAPEKCAALKDALSRNEKIIRFLLIKTEYPKMVPSRRMSFLGRGKPSVFERKGKEVPLRKKPEQKMTEEELDKTIEELVGK